MSVLSLGLCVLALVVLPGLAGGVGVTAFGPRAATTRPGVLVARCLASAVAVWLLTAGLLVRTVGVTAAASLVAQVLLAVVSLLVLRHPRCREVLRGARAEAAYLGGAAGLGLLAWAPIGLLVWTATRVGTLASTPWYYWGLARQVLASGHFPETSPEFARTVPFLADYPLFTAGTAMLMAPLPETSQPVTLAVVVTFAAVVLACAASLLALALGASRATSTAAAPLALTLGVGAYRLLGYRPEGFALGPALLVVVLVVDWYRHRDRASLAAGGVLGAVVSQVHGIAFLGMCLLLLAATATVLITDPGRRRLLGSAAAAAGVLLAGFAGLGVAMGRFSGSETTSGVAGLDADDDPTWAFRKLALGEDPTPAPSAARLVSNSLEDLFEERTSVVLWVLAAAVVVVVTTAVARRGAVPVAQTLRPLVFAVLGAGALLGVGWVLVHSFDTYVPRRTGSQRLFLEATLVVPVLLAGCASALVVLVDLVGGARRTAVRAATAVVVGVAVGGGLLSALTVWSEAEGWMPAEADQAALESLDVPADAVLLANAYTEGYLRQVTGATVLLEGRAPYTFPDQLDRSVDLLLGAKQFYADPVERADYLDRHGVDYVLLSEPESFSVTSANTFDDAAPPEQLAQVPGLEEVLRSPGLAVYRYRP